MTTETPFQELNIMYKDVIDERDRLRTTNAELLAALENLVGACEEDTWIDRGGWLSDARAAIAKARG